ncbi:CHASE domain-containing protein [Lignipirellula cremea]|uniref:histidine kinase n=1 Tax=Lignipirellula cremea TaxID=2528010 RepID=A0A518DVT9_9BACT|nr:CHASE domain-containing protein [Lignipirellula cremea]QDU95947.1 Signal transduction histidine-protein kinase BarA [Lignipirellula cremea]
MQEISKFHRSLVEIIGGACLAATLTILVTSDSAGSGKTMLYAAMLAILLGLIILRRVLGATAHLHENSGGVRAQNGWTVGAQKTQAPQTSQTIDAAWLLVTSRIVLMLALGISLVVMAAWPAHLIELRSLIDGLPTMKFNTALALALLSFAGLLRTATNLPSWARRLPLVLALVVAGIGVASAAESLFHIELGIDTLASLDPESTTNGKSPGRMSIGSALGITLLALSLVACLAGARRVGHALMTLGGLIGFVALVLFIVRASGLRDLGLYSTTAIHTALLLAAIAFSYMLTSRGLRLASMSNVTHVVQGEICRARSMITIVAGTLLLGLVVTGGLVMDAQRNLREANRSRFDHLSRLLTEEAQRRINQTVYGLKGARGLYAASKSVERQEFADHVASRDLPVEFPGAQGFGMIQRVERSDLESWLAAERADDAPDYTLNTTGDASDLFIIQHIYPLETNLAAWGYDIGSEKTRRTAAELAVRSGEPTITGRIELLQDKKKGSGFLYFVPVYVNGSNPTTPQEREAALVGLLYAPIILDVAIGDLADVADGLLDFEVYDGLQANKAAQLYDFDQHLTANEAALRAPNSHDRMFRSETMVTVGGRQWTIVTSSSPKFEAGVDRVTPAMIGVGGALLSALLAGIVWSMGLSRTRAMAFAEDMTQELRLSEEAARLAASKSERLAEIARRTSNAVIITDVAGRIEWVNDGFTRISGYVLDEVKGKRPDEFFQGPKSDPTQAVRLTKAIQNAHGATAELVKYTKDNTEYVAAVEIEPLHDGQTLTGFMAIESDITERCQAEARILASNVELIEARRAAEAASRTKSEFLANMSHELRTPMNSIIGFTQRLLKKLGPSLNEQHLDALQTVDRNARHLLGLINDILDLSKIEAGRMELKPQNFDLVAVVKQTANQCRSLADGKPVTLAFDLPSESIPIEADQIKFTQIVTNLVSNGIKYTPAGTVVVSVRTVEDPRLGAAARVAIRDTGVGIKEEDLERLFQRFSQLDNSNTRSVGGTGLGLFITAEYVAMHGGRIEVNSQFGEGSEFAVLIPFKRAATEREKKDPNVEPRAKVLTPATRPETPRNGLRLLYVDADSQLLGQQQQVLEAAGYEVETADAFTPALQQLALRRPDAVVIRTRTADEENVDLIRAISASEPFGSLPIVAIADDAATAVRAGAHSVLNDQRPAQELLETLRRVLLQSIGELLVVDDDHDTVKLVGQLMLENGVAVRSAGNGAEALAHLENFMPGAIILDLVMPVMGGMEFLEHLRERPRWKQIPVVVMTVKNLSETETQQVNTLCDFVVAKTPDDARGILQAVLQAVASSRRGNPPESSRLFDSSADTTSSSFNTASPRSSSVPI